MSSALKQITRPAKTEEVELNVPYQVMIRPEQGAQYPFRPTKNQTNSILGKHKMKTMADSRI
jgi:hypothetical protein